MRIVNRDAETRRLERCGRIQRSGTAVEDRSFPAILSTSDVARDRHRVFGWKAPESRSVPLVDSHQDADGIHRVLGKVTGIRSGSAGGKRGDVMPAPLEGVVVFAAAGVNPAADTAFRLYEAGYCDALSVSFIPVEAKPARDRGPGAMDIQVAELLEVSVVAVPSDVNAKVLARALRRHARGGETREDRELIARAIQSRLREEEVVMRNDDPAHTDSSPYGRSLRMRRAQELRAQGDAEVRQIFTGVGLHRAPVDPGYNTGTAYEYNEGNQPTPPAASPTLKILGYGRAEEYRNDMTRLGAHLSNALSAETLQSARQHARLAVAMHRKLTDALGD